jgi:predicted transcriptional regulator
MNTQLVTLHLSTSVLNRLDEAARQRKCSRAAILEEAVRAFLGGSPASPASCEMTVARDAGTDEPLYKLNEG